MELLEGVVLAFQVRKATQEHVDIAGVHKFIHDKGRNDGEVGVGHNCVLKILQVIGRGKGLLVAQYAFARGLGRLVVVIELGEDIIMDRREAMIFGVRGEPVIVQVLDVLLSRKKDAINTDRFRGTHSGMVVVSGREVGSTRSSVHSRRV